MQEPKEVAMKPSFLKSFVLCVLVCFTLLTLGCSSLPETPTPTTTLASPYGTPLEEICDGEDQDGDNFIDEGVLTLYYLDEDGDGYGAAKSHPVEGCFAPTGYVESADDCNDAVATVYPGAKEVCDGYDNDCDGQKDEGCPR